MNASGKRIWPLLYDTLVGLAQKHELSLVGCKQKGIEKYKISVFGGIFTSCLKNLYNSFKKD